MMNRDMQAQAIDGAGDGKAVLLPGERVDDLQCRGYNIIQNPDVFCFGMDAVLLADFATGRAKGQVMDLGTGTGVIPMLMEARNKGAFFTGLELQQYSADMARRSVCMNGLQDKISIVCGDIKEVPCMFKAASFDVVTSNPPYIKGNHGLENTNTPKNIARHEICLSLEDVVKAAAHLLKEGGTFAMVHKPFRLAEIIRLLSAYRLEPKRICMVQPYADKEPNMVLIESNKGGNPMVKIEPALIVYNQDGSYTEDLLHRYDG
ncbi:MAG: tRNA1(Val) (adenine(37)-N6)-methyltransferase [Eubacteriales bacterium]|nr:tRNA1(Val) (adenine(37)-N6)-methyltransferase [Lachnospiraceae bacterium]MDO5126704.1 tRNA1(Val) (adenine(37)-N6)-methyltransferase [Eubacteriales bacterium]